MIYGYARVSTKDQNLEQQIFELKKAGIEDKNIFREKMSTRKALPELDSLVSILAEGDKVVCYSLDRIGRSLKELIGIVELFKSRGVDFECIKQKIDTTTAIGQMMFHITAAFAEYERELIRERTLLGLQEARRKGRYPGPKPKLTLERVALARERISTGNSVSSTARMLGVLPSTLFRRLKKDRIS